MYTTSDGRHANTEPVYLNPSVGLSITADAESAILELGDRACLRLRQNVTANAATSLVTTIYGSEDRVNWFTLGVFAAVTTPAAESKSFPGARWVKAGFNHTGSGAIVVTLSGEAV